jgi:hypothetical protein
MKKIPVEVKRSDLLLEISRCGKNRCPHEPDQFSKKIPALMKTK